MNPKSEFVKAIMSVLRLESNIYTTGAIETIIERLEVTDYQLFIAYLGERKADYEKPIENIAKGVEEYYQLKLEPHKKKADAKISEIVNKTYNIQDMFSKEAKKIVESSSDIKIEIEEEVKKHYGKQSSQIQENQRYQCKMSYNKKKNLELIEEFCSYEQNDVFFKKLIYGDKGHRVFTDDDISLIFQCGGFKSILERGKNYNNDFDTAMYDHFLKGKIKPSVEDKIAINEDDSLSKSISISAIKQLAITKRYV